MSIADHQQCVPVFALQRRSLKPFGLFPHEPSIPWREANGSQTCLAVGVSTYHCNFGTRTPKKAASLFEDNCLRGFHTYCPFLRLLSWANDVQPTSRGMCAERNRFLVSRRLCRQTKLGWVGCLFDRD